MKNNYENWEKLSPEQQRQSLAQIGLNDLFYFNREVLKYKDMQEQPHLELCRFIQRPSRKKLILMPRGSFKSSVVTIGYSLQALVKNPDVRILIDSETFGQSKKFLHEIKGHLERNDLFKQLYGDLRREPGWTDSEITVATRTKNLKEPTITTTGLDVARLGLHTDKIILDDPVSQNNIGTKEQIEKVIEHYKLLLSILEPGGELIIIGTTWHFLDLYAHIQENEKEVFDILKKKAIQDDGSLLFPQRLNEKFLDEQRRLQGSYIFSGQYQNEPVDEASAIFKRSWLKYYEVAPGGLSITTTIDPAISKEKSGDYTAIVTVGVDHDNNIYVLNIIRGKFSPKEIVDNIYKIYDTYKPKKIGMETVAFQKALKFYLDTQFSHGFNSRPYLRIEELKTDTRTSKETRISALQPRFEMGKVFMHKNMVDLQEELLRFPKGRSDDIIDALAYQLQILGLGKKKGERTGEEEKYSKLSLPKKKNTVWWEQQREELERMDFRSKWKKRGFYPE